MIRDLGSLRQPSAYIAIGSTIVFLAMCWLLHRRDRFVAAEPGPQGSGGRLIMGQYLPLVVLMLLAIAFGGLSFVASRLLAPRRPSAAKEAPYECGIVPSREPPDRFPVSFYVVAMLFIMFDIEIIFLYPYAVGRAALGEVGLLGDRRVLGDLLPDVRLRGRPRRPRMGSAPPLPQSRVGRRDGVGGA